VYKEAMKRRAIRRDSVRSKSGENAKVQMPKAKLPARRAEVVRPIFPTPDHDHDRCLSNAMAIAETQCAERGQRLTEFRREVLAALLATHQPLGAYEIMERVTPGRPRPAPITVYRALEFLRENGLIHRIESRNAFIACVHTHSSGTPVVFLLCENCGVVGEVGSPKLAAAIKSAAESAGFIPKSPVIEIGGSCLHCKTATLSRDRRAKLQ
jgi:Fur family transcriptional regulator, zinc uptake regulator